MQGHIIRTFSVVCMDEKPFQLLDERYERIKAKPGKPEKVDYQYERCGVCSIFIFTEPLGGWRYTKALERRTKIDWANMVKFILDTQYPNAKKVVLVMDNLNTHVIANAPQNRDDKRRTFGARLGRRFQSYP